MPHKPTAFELTAMAVSNTGGEITPLPFLPISKRSVVAADFKTELHTEAHALALSAHAAILKSLAVSHPEATLACIRVRAWVRRGERAPAGFANWEQATKMKFQVIGDKALSI